MKSVLDKYLAECTQLYEGTRSEESRKNFGLEEYYESPEKDLHEKSLLKEKKIAHELNVSIEDYKKLLILMKIAYADEQNGDPEEHAYKLLRTFGNFENAIQYLKQFEALRHSHIQMVHTACLFNLPTLEREQWKLWQRLAQKFMLDARFGKCLANAAKIEAYVKENRKTLEEEAQAKAIARYEHQLSLDYDKLAPQTPLDLKEYIAKKMEQSKATSEAEAKKRFSHNTLEKLKIVGKPSASQKEDLKSYNKSEVGLEEQKKTKEIVMQEYREKFTKEHAQLFSENENKQKWIAKRLEKDKAIIRGNIENAKKLILSEGTSLETLMDYYSNTSYANAKRNPTAALLFFENGMNEDEFNRYLTLVPVDSDQIPDIQIEGSKTGYPNLYLKKLSPQDPRAAILGKLTSCCQSLGGAGESCAVHGITQPNSGFYVLCQCKKGQLPSNSDDIVAQCWAWRSEDNRIVFDSIESQINFQQGNKGNNQFILSDFFVLLAHQLVTKHNISQVLVGGGATPRHLNVFKSPAPAMPKDYKEYRDSNSQSILADSKNALCAKINVLRPLALEVKRSEEIKPLQKNLEGKPSKEISQLIFDKPLNLTKAQIIKFAEFCIPEKNRYLSGIFEKTDPSYKLFNDHLNLLLGYISSLKERPANFEKIYKFIRMGVNINLKTDYSIYQPSDLFKLAIEEKNIDFLRFLIEKKGFDVNQKIPTGWDEIPALAFASDKAVDAAIHAAENEIQKEADWSVVRFLMDNGADVGVMTAPKGKSVVNAIILLNDWDFAAELLQKNKLNFDRLCEIIERQKNIPSVSLLKEIMKKIINKTINRSDIIKWIEHCAQLKYSSRDGVGIIENAKTISLEDKKIAIQYYKLLTDYQEEISQKNPSLEKIIKFIKQGEDINLSGLLNLRGTDGTIFERAIKESIDPLLHYLVEKQKMDVNMPGRDGTPVIMAAKAKQWGVVKYLVEVGKALVTDDLIKVAMEFEGSQYNRARYGSLARRENKNAVRSRELEDWLKNQQKIQKEISKEAKPILTSFQGSTTSSVAQDEKTEKDHKPKSV